MLEQCDYCGEFKSVLMPVILWQEPQVGQHLEICHDCYAELTEEGEDLEFDNDDEPGMAYDMNGYAYDPSEPTSDFYDPPKPV